MHEQTEHFDDKVIIILEALAQTLEALSAPRVAEIKRDQDGRAIGVVSRLSTSHTK